MQPMMTPPVEPSFSRMQNSENNIGMPDEEFPDVVGPNINYQSAVETDYYTRDLNEIPPPSQPPTPPEPRMSVGLPKFSPEIIKEFLLEYFDPHQLEQTNMPAIILGDDFLK